MRILMTLLCLKLFFQTSNAQESYFPPSQNDAWEHIDPASIGWDLDKLAELKAYLEAQNTKSFVILYKGKIAVEWYFAGHDTNKPWYWASAGKTLTAGLVGIAEQQGLLSFEDSTAKYLGKGWTSCTEEREALIKVKHQLTMTSGLDESVSGGCTEPKCLECLAMPGERWSYHNSPYTLLDGVIENATGDNLNEFFKKNIGQKIDMNGLYIKSDYNNVFYSSTLSMARYGLLLLNEGKWKEETIIKREFVQSMSKSSQNINPSYGILSWLNGKEKVMLPSSQIRFNGPLLPSAPMDLFAALGKNDQKLHVVPSLDLVLVRMGEAAGDTNLSVPLSLDEGIWKILLPAMHITTSTENLSKHHSADIFQSAGKISVALYQNEMNLMLLYDSTGNVVGKTSQPEIPTSELRTGIYFVLVQLKGGGWLQKKIFISN